MSIYKHYRDAGIRNKWGHKMIYATCSVCGEEILTRWAWIKDVKKCNNIRTLTGTKKLGIPDKKISSVLNGMICRCYSPRQRDYKWYGGKGIKICDEWLNSPNAFYEWYMSESKGMNNLTIDRIDGDKDYCPENCRLVTMSENTRWKSTTMPIEVNGIKLTGRQWADAIGHSTNFVNKYRRKYGEADTIRYIMGCLRAKKDAAA